jgi:hypothetical protein
MSRDPLRLVAGFAGKGFHSPAAGNYCKAIYLLPAEFLWHRMPDLARLYSHIRSGLRLVPEA